MLGWQNSATYGSVISYNLYWLVVIAMFVTIRFQEVKGRWPWSRATKTTSEVVERKSLGSEKEEEKAARVVDVQPVHTVAE